jgi:hypothetical protein
LFITISPPSDSDSAASISLRSLVQEYCPLQFRAATYSHHCFGTS